MMIYALLPAFNTLANKELPYSYILQTPVLLSLVGIVMFVGIIGGSYPAFYLSGFNPVNVLKGKLAVKGGSVVFQKSAGGQTIRHFDFYADLYVDCL